METLMGEAGDPRIMLEAERLKAQEERKIEDREPKAAQETSNEQGEPMEDEENDGDGDGADMEEEDVADDNAYETGYGR